MPDASVPLGYVELGVSLFLGILGLLWLGVTWRVYVNNERRLVALEEYKANEAIRTELLISKFREMLLKTEMRIGDNLESKRDSIESTITAQVSEVVKTIKNGGAK
jgi:hypothetical protein